MKLGIPLHLADLSLSNTVSELDKSSVQRSRKVVHDWVQKADLQPVSGEAPNQVALDETVIRVNNKQFWLYAAVDPETNHVLHIRLYPRRKNAITEMFLAELKEKHDVKHAEFLVDGAPWLQTACDRHGLRFRHVTHGNRNSIECVYWDKKRRITSFANTFSHSDPVTT